MIEDTAGRKMATIYDAGRRRLALNGLMPWIAQHRLSAGDYVTFTRLDSEGMAFRIELEAPPAREADASGLFLGWQKDLLGRFETQRPLRLPLDDLVTHAFVCGVTGSGKTVMLKAILEEAILRDVPALIIDLKGDLSSLALAFSRLAADEFRPWVQAVAGQTLADAASQAAQKHRSNLEHFGLGEADVRHLAEKASYAVFTPRRGNGIPLAVTSLLEAPEGVDELLVTDPGYVLEMVDDFTTSLVKILFADRRLGRLNKYKTYLSAIVHHAWANGNHLVGKAGLHAAQQFVLNPPISEIGGMPVMQFMKDKEREELAARIAMTLSGGEQLWFQGAPLDIDVLMSRPHDGRVPVTIVNLRELLSFDDQILVVAHISHALFLWARRQGEAFGRPRLLFVLDEIGGGGGRQAFFPSPPYETASKAGLNRLLRQGRGYGIACLFATQNPGDVDYKGLSNCGTWIIGRLQTDRDRKKVMQGMSAAEMHVDRVEDRLRNLNYGEFLIKMRSGPAQIFCQRWLLTHHVTVASKQLANLNSPAVANWFGRQWLG